MYHDLLQSASQHPHSHFIAIELHIDCLQDRGCPGDDGFLEERLLGILLTYFYTMDYVVSPTMDLRQRCTMAMWTCLMAEKFALHGLQRRALAQFEALLRGPCHANTDLMVDLIDIAYMGVYPTLGWSAQSDDSDHDGDDEPREGLEDCSEDELPTHDKDCEAEATEACGYADLIDVINMRPSSPESLSTLSSCEVCRGLRSKFPRAFSVSRWGMDHADIDDRVTLDTSRGRNGLVFLPQLLSRLLPKITRFSGACSVLGRLCRGFDPSER